jgi:hypothetical protein
VQTARYATPGADGELSCQMRLSTCRKSGNLLVPDMQPLDLPLPTNGIGNAVEAIANNTVDALDASSCKDVRELISNSSCHLGLP